MYEDNFYHLSYYKLSKFLTRKETGAFLTIAFLPIYNMITMYLSSAIFKRYKCFDRLDKVVPLMNALHHFAENFEDRFLLLENQDDGC